MFVLFLCNLYRLLYTIFKYYASPRLKKIYRCDITATVSLMSYLGIFCKFSRGLFYIYICMHAFFAGRVCYKVKDFDSLAKKNAFSLKKTTNFSVNL